MEDKKEIKLKGQAEIIKDAFLAKIPENKEEWPEYYKHRMEICSTCEHNTANGAIGRMGKFASRKIGPQCSICLCLLNRKCWSKVEECGLAEIGQEPKWERIAIETVGSEDYFDIVNNSWEKSDLSLTDDKKWFKIDCGDVKEGEMFDFMVEIHPRKPLFLHVIHVCSCMDKRSRMLDEKTGAMEFNFRFRGDGEGFWSKIIHFEYTDEKIQEGMDPSTMPKKSVFITVVANIIKGEGDDTTRNT